MDTHKNTFEIAELIFRYIRDEVSAEEKGKLEKWLKEKPENQELFNKIIEEGIIKNKILKYQSYDKQKAWKRIFKETVETQYKSKMVTLRILKYAAAILLPVIIGTYMFFYIKIEKNLSNFSRIKPGSQKAILVLENGKTINLGNTTKQEIITSVKSNIIDTNNTLVYDHKAALLLEKKVIFNTLQTPQGGEYNLILADGTKIWLNAASEIKYPVQFNDSIRRVFLEGEAYFEVAENKTTPFIVNTNNMEITVLGTSFDVMAYHDEGYIKTTLVKGNVKIETITGVVAKRGKAYLQPGQQAVLEKESNELEVKKVDTEIYTSWKEGKFVFNNETLDEIMRRLQRWYAFEIRYTDEETKHYHFSGTLKRYENISNIIEMMEMTTTIKFEVKNNLILVKKVNK